MDYLPQQGSVTPCNASTSILIDAQDISLECREAEARHILPALCQRVHRLGSTNEALPSVPVALDCKPCAEGQRQQITPAHQSDLFVLGFRRIALNMPSITAPCLNVLVTQTPCQDMFMRKVVSSPPPSMMCRSKSRVDRLKATLYTHSESVRPADMACDAMIG